MDKQKTRLTGFIRALSLLLCLHPLVLLSQNDATLFPPKPEPAVYVHDYAGWLSSGDKQSLEMKLRRYWDSTSTQIVVMIRPDIGDYDKAGYAFELGNRWGIGRADKDNGIVMLIKTEQPERGIFIATGYGTEGALPDILAGRIIRETMSPYFRQNQYAQGINAGVDDIIRALSGEFKRDQGAEVSDASVLVILLFVFGLLILFMVVMFRLAKKNKATWYTHDGRRSPRRNHSDPWGRGGGGWWIGGGGGGGSDSGGGWSGGGDFGGGSFGGGGAGGDW